MPPDDYFRKSSGRFPPPSSLNFDFWGGTPAALKSVTLSDLPIFACHRPESVCFHPRGEPNACETPSAASVPINVISLILHKSKGTCGGSCELTAVGWTE